MAIIPGPSTRIPPVSTLLGSDLSRSVVLRTSSASWRKLAYSPYGYTEYTEPAILHYTGQPIETPTDLYILGNGYRMYSPTLCRFSAPDTLAPFDQGGLSAYAYTEQDPINSTDVSGLFGVKLFVRFLPKRPSIARSPVIPGKLAYRKLPNGMRSMKDLRKQGAAMTERPGYLFDRVTMAAQRPLPPPPPTGVQPGKLRLPGTITSLLENRPTHIYHVPEGIKRKTKPFHILLIPRSTNPEHYRSTRERMRQIPLIVEGRD